MAPEPMRITRGRRRARERRARRRQVVRRVSLALLLAVALAGGAVTAGAVLRDDPGPRRAEASPTASTTSPTTTAPPATAVPPTTAVPPPPTEPPRDPRRGNGQPVTFAFGGDVHFEGGLRGKLAGDPAGIFAAVAPVLTLADVAVVNLESAITERGEPHDKPYTFRSPPAGLLALGAAGVDVVSLANNHGLDYGQVGLLDTLEAKAATPAPVVIGVGGNAGEAYAPHRVDVRGQRVAVFTATQVLDGDVVDSWPATDSRGGLASAKGSGVDRLVAGVSSARLDSDTVVVFLHWGIEKEACPSADQRLLAQLLVEAGADIVVGGHAHRQQGAGRLGTAFVAYGLGNFAFYNEEGPAGVTGVLLVTATGRDTDSYTWVPGEIEGGVPEPLPEG
ncbi:MAG TPA: CapA family protein, partial [Acidimicrobiia bacterium]